MYGSGRVERRCRETLVPGVLLMVIIVGQGHIVFSIGACGVF